MVAKPLLLAVALLCGSAPAQAACIDELNKLQARFDETFGEAPPGTEATTVQPVSAKGQDLALTGDPLNPKPPAPSTAEVPTATPTSEEVTSAMPGADASVELDVEQNTQTFSTIRDEATAMSQAGNEAGCLEKLTEAEVLFPANN